MNRARLYLWSLLHSRENLDDNTLSELAGQRASELSFIDREQRRSDMEAAVGAWAERTDLPDSSTYVANLRDHARSERQLPA